jgi:4-hydroxybenzoyl-CoA thioesterase
MMLTANRRIEIQFGDCDPAGIIYFPNFYRFFDDATAHLISAALGMRKRDWIKQYGIVGIPVVNITTDFRAPSRYGDHVDIESTITKVGRASFGVHHRLHNGGTLAAESEETRVWVAPDPHDPDRFLPTQIPDEVRAAMRGERG